MLNSTNLLMDKSSLDKLMEQLDRERTQRLARWDEMRKLVEQLGVLMDEAKTSAEQKGMLKDGYIDARPVGEVLYEINRLQKELALDFSF